MRGFFILLLLTNILFVAWQYFAKERVQEKNDIYHGISMVKDGLTLLSELPPEKQPALREGLDEVAAASEPPMEAAMGPAAEAAVNPAQGEEKVAPLVMQSSDGAICLRIAEIDGRSTLDKILGLLRSNGATAIEQGEIQSTRLNYWVMLPPYPSRAKADEAAAILNARRVKDFFIVRSGEYENAVSLGVFSTEERAKRRYAQLVDMKVRLRNPRIETIELPAKRYTVSYKISSERARRTLDTTLTRANVPVGEEIRCK